MEKVPIVILSLRLCSHPKHVCAIVDFRLGPILIRHAKIMEQQGYRWLAMPSRSASDGHSIYLAYIRDPLILRQLTQKALSSLDALKPPS